MVCRKIYLNSDKKIEEVSVKKEGKNQEMWNGVQKSWAVEVGEREKDEEWSKRCKTLQRM